MKRLAQSSAQRLRQSAGALAVTALAAGTLAGTLSSPAWAAPARYFAAARPAAAAAYTFRTLNNNHDRTFNQLLGINNSGVIAGYLGSGAHGHPNKGYRLHAPYHQGNYASENYPGSRQTQVTGLNDLGVTVGFWSTQNKVSQVNNNFGFYARGGHFHEVNFPASGSASPPVDQLLGVNDRNVAVGFYVNAQGDSRGYEYNIKTARFSRVLLPGIPNLSAKVSLTATAINSSGAVAGFYSISGGTTFGFLKTASGHATKLAVHGASLTQPFGVNDLGEVVGAYAVGSGSSAATHGFTWTRAHGFRTVDDPHGIGATLVNGVNGRGDLVGFYTDSAGNTDGMLALP
jgi:hypothetical protein